MDEIRVDIYLYVYISLENFGVSRLSALDALTNNNNNIPTKRKDVETTPSKKEPTPKVCWYSYYY